MGGASDEEEGTEPPAGAIRVLGKRIIYRAVRGGLNASGVAIVDRDPRALLLWTDALRACPWAQGVVRPWQIVNRLPFARVFCCKVPFVNLVKKMQQGFPDLHVIPPSWILPQSYEAFEVFRKEFRTRMILKPDRGSLGCGIHVLEADARCPRYSSSNPYVAQAYINSCLWGGRKFDFRVYALVASMKPLQIFVHKRGIARFASAPAGECTRFSMLTNTAVNMKNPAAAPGSMTRTISEVLEEMRATGVDVERLWARIEDVVVYALLAGVAQFESTDPPSAYTRSRAFQIFGVDVILDVNLNPYVLELNCRPSLKANTKESLATKVKVVGDTLELVLPPQGVQEWLDRLATLPTTVEELARVLPSRLRKLSDHRHIWSGNEWHCVVPAARSAVRRAHEEVIAFVRSQTRRVT